MGVETKMFITSNKEKMFEIMPKLIKDLNKWLREKLDEYWESEGFETRLQYIVTKNKDSSSLKNYSNGIRTCYTYDFNSFSITFSVNDENRKLHISPNCTNDYSDIYEGEKIIFSLGYWGMSEEIMMVIAESIKDFGRIFYVGNDYSGNFKELFV